MLLTLLFALWAIPYSSVKTKRNLVFVNKEEGKKYCCLQWPCLSLHKRTNKKCHVDESVCKGRLHVYWNCVCVCVCVCVCGGVHSMGVGVVYSMNYCLSVCLSGGLASVPNLHAWNWKYPNPSLDFCMQNHCMVCVLGGHPVKRVKMYFPGLWLRPSCHWINHCTTNRHTFLQLGHWGFKINTAERKSCL